MKKQNEKEQMVKAKQPKAEKGKTTRKNKERIAIKLGMPIRVQLIIGFLIPVVMLFSMAIEGKEG